MSEANSYFAIGTNHDICEDYTLAGIFPGVRGARPAITVAMVSDGCSSSPNTDWGSRFLCHSARQVLAELAYIEEDGYLKLEPLSTRGNQIYARADGMRQSCGVSPLVNDATLLVAYWPDLAKNISVVAWGDGVIAARCRHTGAITYHVIECAGNAPGYLAYSGSPERKALFLEHTNNGEHSISSFQLGEEGLTNWEQEHGLEPVVRDFPIADYDLVAVLSDGAQAFQVPENSDTGKGMALIPVSEVLEQIMAVPHPLGEFVVRRVRNGFLRRFCVGNSWTHYDDLGVGMVFVSDEDLARRVNETLEGDG